VTAIGGTAPLTFTISPALPAGLTINASTGAISGTPTATLAARAETVTITDNTGAKVTGAFTLKVTALTSTVRTASVKFMQNLVVASTVPITVTGGSTPYVYSISPALPAGLTFNTTSGAITGTPTASIPATVETVTIRDSNGAQITNTFTLQVSPPITGTVLIASQTITKATAITSFTPVVGGGSAYGGFKYTATLPAGLTINVNTGAITGTAPATAAAAKNYSIKITDSANFSISKTFSLTIV
jgi:hypothetical protein